MKKSVIALSLMAALCAPAFADQEPEYDSWVAGFVELYNPDGSKTAMGEDYANSVGVGAEFGHRFLPNWATRLEWSRISLDPNSPFVNEEKANRIGIDAMYFVNNDAFYVFGGYKHLDMEDSDNMMNLGIGKHIHYKDNLRFIVEAAAYHDFGQGYDDLGFKFGMAYTFGGSKTPAAPKDSDNDGVYDNSDQCPNTPMGVTVDSMGCNVDSDGDGVLNSVDQCPNTPAGTRVDATGCNWDKDGDGIGNDIDMCPNTPAGTVVGAKGCALEIDSDQDGVLDTVDQCAGTPLTDKVDTTGCSVFMEVEVRQTLNVLFGNNSDVVQNPDDPKFQEFADFMNRFPNTKTAIEGHASAPGKAEYNMTISLKRARAVRQLLIDKYGIDANRISAEGFGETRLLDTSNTAEANRINRRIEARVTAMQQEKVQRGE